MLQRVLSKRDLAAALEAGGKGGGGRGGGNASKRSSAFSRDELRELFSLDVRTRCGTREIMLKKKEGGVNYGRVGGAGKKKRREAGGGSGREEEDEDDDDDGEDAATEKWRQTAAACAPGDAESGAPEILAGSGLGLADGRTQLLAAVLATGRVSWVHEEDGKASATEEDKVDEEVKVEEEEVEEGGGGEGEEEEEALPAAALAAAASRPAPLLPGEDDAAPAGRTAVDDESLLEVE